MDKEHLLIPKEKSMKENGGMIKLKVLVYIHILIVLNMKESGTKIYSMEKDPKNGRMDQYLVESIEMAKRMV